jgi:hypothetical protein
MKGVRYTIVALALALSACAPKTVEVVRTVTVSVPVPVPCDVQVVENDVDLAPLVRAADGILPRVEIVLDALEYVTAQRDAERAARKACNAVGP